MKILRDRSGGAKMRLIIPKLVVLSERKHILPRRFGRWLLVSGSIVLSLLVVAVLFFSPIGVIEKRTSGDITFTDSAGNLLSGTLNRSVAGTSLEPANAYYVSWTNVPNAGIYFDALATKSLAVNFRISGDSPKGKVILENYGSNLPGGVNISAPVVPVKYMEISTTGVSFAEAEISILYTGSEIKGLDEKTLAIYRYDSAAQAWSELPTKIDAKNNTLSTTVNSLSIFAVSAKGLKIEVRDTRNTSVVSDIKTYDEGKTMRKTAEKTDTLSASDISDKGEVEIDALSNKNVAVKLKINRASGGEVVLDDYGKNNPVPVPLPGKVIRFVEIGAINISYSSAIVTIRYSNAELDGVDENSLVIYHWNGASWEALLTTVDTVNNTLSATTDSLSPFGVSTGYGYINAMVARKVILDEPYGTLWNPDTGSGGTNWENGQSVTQYVYGVVISNYGLPIQGANITGFYTAANGSTNLFPFSGTTDTYGEFNFSTSLDNQVRLGQTSNAQGPNEGTWNVTINITYNSTTTSMTRDFILGEYGCGRSGTGCHTPSGSAVGGKGDAMTAYSGLSHDPYIEGVAADGKPYQSSHMVYAKPLPDATSGAEHNAPTDTVAGTNCNTCHRGYDQKGYNTTNTYLNNATALSTNDLHEVNGVKCKDCHGNFTVTSGTNNYVQLKYEVPQCYNSTCHANTTNVPKTWVQSKNDSYSWNQRAHDTNQTIACIFCHGPYHNITKPNSTIPGDYSANGITESEYCLNNCHKNQRYHNGSGGVQCTVCHSQAAHEIRYFNSAGNYTYNITQSPSRVNVGRNYSGKCSTCHQKPYFANILNNTKNPNDNYSVVNGSYSKGADGAKLVSDPIRHSNALNNGTKWDNGTRKNPYNYWNASADSDSCIYCHGNVYNNVGYSFTESALGHVWKFMGNNTVNSSISLSTYWCASCHWQGYTSGTTTYNDMVNSFLSDNDMVPPEITGNATYGANQSVYEYTNHSLYSKNDSACNLCHGYRYGFTTITQLMHNQSRVGGPNCADCHDTGGIVLLSHVNVTAANDTNAIHKNLNSGASASNTTTYYSNNKRCWACHGNGSEPSPNAHPTNYKTPYNCTACHLQSGSQNFNFTPNSTLLSVTHHYWNGTNISTANATSCYACHNKSEMMIPANDLDNGSGAVYGGANGGNNSTSHYGRKRTDYSIIQGTNDYCYRCHNNASTVFPFIDVNNMTIANHSMNYNSTNPACSDCHAQGRLHNSTLTKPAFTLPNSTFCTSSCHGIGGTATIKNLSRHNNTLNCTQCHLNSTGSIHPVRYLQQDGLNWSTTNNTAINCTSCHQTRLTNFSNAPIIPTPLKHSSNISNGSIWGTYWTSESGSCYYCHNNTKHNSTAFGTIYNLLVDTNNTRNGTITTTTWCANCHYNDTVNTNYLGTRWSPVPPLITVNNTVNVRWQNHSTYLTSGYKDSNCQTCHALNGSYLATSLNYSHSIDEGIAGGPDCINCHDIAGSGAPGNKRIKVSSMKLGVHKNLNSNATNSSSIDPINKACWACHGDGTEPAGHPQRYKTPRKCSNNDCHSLSQSFKAPMVYSHFKDAELNSNPGNVTSYNVSTGVLCEACHSNSLSAESVNLNASVSHYATSENLIDSINCIYCHLDRDNSIKWGNATEINKNRSSLVEMDRIKNKFSARTGEFVDLGLGYRIRVTGISALRGSAILELYKEENLVYIGLVNIGRYVYEENRIINNASSKIPVIVLNITDMFLFGDGGFIQFEGFRIKRLHNENKTTSCYLCHFKDGEKHKYTVIDRIDKDVFYTEVLFNSSDMNEYEREQALLILANLTPANVHVSIERPKRKTLQKGEIWKLAGNYSLTLEDAAENSDSASFLLEAGGKNQTNIVKRGETLGYEWNINYLGYTYTKVVIFRAKVSEISQNIVVLEDIVALSPNIVKINVNSTIYGYNASWLWKNNTFMIGMIPSDLHATQLYDGSDGGAACTSCHNVGELGAHKDINKAAFSGVSSENKACWACHGEGKEPKWHPSNYKNPRKCKSCHVERGVTYNATYIGDEKHGALVNCNQCHVVDTHKIIRFDVTPGIKKLSISKDEVYEGEKVRIYATAVAGYEMRIRGAEYYIDSIDKPAPMLTVDGSFDEQIEEMTAEIDTTGLKPGNHSIYARAMERNNKWGPVSSISLIVKEKESAIVTKKSEKIPDVPGFLILILMILSQHIRKNKLLR